MQKGSWGTWMEILSPPLSEIPTCRKTVVLHLDNLGPTPWGQVGEEMGPRFLWKEDSRRDPGDGHGASVTWACACPGLCCWWGLLARVRGDGEGGSMDVLLYAVPWGALWTQCLWARQKVSGHQSASYGASQTYRQPPSTNTPTTLCTQLHRGCRCPSIWQSSIHTGTEQSTSGILLPHCQPILRCDRIRTTGHNVPTNMLLPRERTSPQFPLPCTWRWGQLELPRKGSSGGKAWCGQL